jgi:hypothetical protein
MVFTGCRSSAPVTPLSIYIVSQEEVEGGRLIDTPDFPKLGYIGPTPDLVITKLETVGTNTSGQPGQPRPGVVIMLRAEDAQKFATLSEKAVMKKVLFMVGDTPLTALGVMSPLDAAQTRSLQLALTNQADQTRIENELRKLTR